MKKAYYGLYFRFLMNKIHGKKIVGKASRNEIEELCKKVAKSIAQVNSRMTEEEIYEELVRKSKIVYTEQLPAFSGSQGIAILNTIFIDQSTAFQIINNEIDKQQDSEDFHVIVHECIHKLQHSKLTYRGKSVRGFIEGATELMALRAARKERSHYYGDGISTNFPKTAYSNQVSIMAQLEVIFGKEILEDYVFTPQSQDLLDRLRELLGDEQFELLRNDMTQDSKQKETEYDFYYWQDTLLETYFDAEIGNIHSQEEAEKYLSRLKQMESVRIKIDGDDTFKNYYLDKLNALLKIFPDLDSEKYGYEECKFYPELYYEEEIKRLDDDILKHLTPHFGTIEDFQNINLEDYKRYRLVKDDKIFEVLTRNGEVRLLLSIDEDGEYAFFYTDNNNSLQQASVGAIFEKKIDDTYNLLAESGVSVRSEDGKILLSVNPPLADSSLENEEMEEIPLNVTKKEIYDQMLIDESDGLKIETWFEKLKRFFTRPKMLPPYSQIHEETTVESFRERYELTQEEKEQIDRSSIQRHKEQDDNEIEQQIDTETYRD